MSIGESEGEMGRVRMDTRAAPGHANTRWASLLEHAQSIGTTLNETVAPLLDLFVRIWLAQGFFASGLLKTINWPATVYLYTAEHPLPGVAPDLAASLGTGIELICPLLLLVGLATRAASLPLLASLAFLHFTYKAVDADVYQMLLLGVLAVRGAGPLSLDHAIAPNLVASALPFGRSYQRLGAWLHRRALPFALLVVRLITAVMLARAFLALPSEPTTLASASVAAFNLMAMAFAFGLGTRLAALLLLLLAWFHAGMSASLSAGDGGTLLTLGLILMDFALRGSGGLALDRLISQRLIALYPSLGGSAEWLDGAPRVVIVGAGFGGIAAARGLRHAWANVTLVDRRNYHLFQPLLYQVATASLSPAEIATPIRTLVRGQTNCRVVMGRVSGIDPLRREVLLDEQRLSYDYLVLATGARHSYFGRDDWERFAPGLKKIDDATAMRGRILRAFERAETCADADERARLLTFVIVGGGPTGVELAGAIAELAQHGMRGEFRTVDPASARVILVQSAPRLLPAMPETLSAAAQRALQSLHVDVRTGAKVEEIDARGVRIGEVRIEAASVLWAAGVMASPAGRWIGAPRDRSGRVIVGADLSVDSLPGVYALGDTAACPGADGAPLPGLAAVAKQQGAYVARRIRALIEGRPAEKPFRYRDLGSMATIGRKAAVADLRGMRLSGSIAWWLWGAVHVGFLVDVRSRVAVLVEWFWSYMTYARSIRLITGNEGGVD
ncbi:MAG: FAD-dependent oxidoreductase [Rhodospirillales bacterium]|nr:FAD-dependent oxidoreductase [Rhodospirillales bacterium]